MTAVAERTIRVAVAKDRLSAHLILTATAPAAITRDTIVTALKDANVPVTSDVERRIEEIVQAAQSGHLPAEPPVIAEGRAPTEGTPATFELAAELIDNTQASSLEDSDQARTDFHRSQIITVGADQVIGAFTPETPSVPGVDVHAKPIPVGGLLQSIQLGENVRCAEDGRTVVATVAGKVHLTHREISVVEVVEIAEDVDFSTGNVEAPTHVLINGTVRDSFKVTSRRSITVRGAIEAADIQAGTEVQVNGGITSRGLGRVVAGGEIFTKFCNEADLHAQGDITIIREAMNSRIYTCGHLRIERGSLIGGRTYAREGAQIHEIGNESDTRTEIAIGIDPSLYVEARKGDEAGKKKREAVTRIRQAVQPLMAQLKRLTPYQREKATELMYQADSLEAEIHECEANKQREFKARSPQGEEPSLTVTKIIYPGVSVVFGDKITTFHKERKGPFKIVRRQHNRVEEILLVDKLSGSVTVLNSREYRRHEAEPVATR